VRLDLSAIAHQQGRLLCGICLRDSFCRRLIGVIEIGEKLLVNRLALPSYGDHLIDPLLGEVEVELRTLRAIAYKDQPRGLADPL
jgi:hypothetical protein